MAKNVLVITGSPRKNGNSDKMAEAFIKGAKSKGHEVVKFMAGEKDIAGCKACETCWSKETACSFEDGFTALEPLLEKADAIVFVSPLYWFGMSAQIKACIDRLYAYVVKACKRPLKIKQSALLMCGQLDRSDIFDGVIETYKLQSGLLGWENAGVVTVSKVAGKEDILNTDTLEKAEKLGMSI